MTYRILQLLLFTTLSVLISISDPVRGQSGLPDSSQNSHYVDLRTKMIRNQIEARGITDSSLLQAMKKVERHLFVPEKYLEFAYRNTPLPIGLDQTISQPFIVAIMTQSLAIESDSRVLEIGTGSGYQAAILGELCAEVFSIEIVPELAERSSRLLHELGYDNISVRCGNGYLGWPDMAPFDAIIVTCAPPEIPEALLRQLKKGGRMIVPVGEDNQMLQLITMGDSLFVSKEIIPVRFVPMTGALDSSNHK